MTDDLSRPKLTIFPPELDEPAQFVIQAPPSPCRVAVLGDEPLLTNEHIYAHAEAEAWPQMIASVQRKGLRPDGEWAMLIAPRTTDWRDLIAPEIIDKIDARIRENPSYSVQYVVMIVDSAHIKGPFRLSDFN